MQQLFVYLLKVIGVSVLLLLYYIIALRNKKFHYYNRFYLLFTVALSMILPLLQLSWFTFSSNSAQAINIYKIIYPSGGENFLLTGNASFNWQQSGFILLVAFSGFLLLQLIFSIFKIYRLKKVYPVKKLEEFDFVDTDLQSAPFSFLNNIFWRNDIQLNESLGRQILQHEIIHIKQKHSLDKIFMQLVLCFYWINPFFWWLKKELYLIHEFIADEKSLKNNDAAGFAKMLLAAKLGKFNFLPAQPFFYSSIKRRLLMITTSKKTQLNYLRRIMALPLLAGILCLFAFKLNEQKSLNIKHVVSETHFKLVVDAGHGGQDYGVAGNGLYEKNITLKIAEKVKALSAEYGIDVVLTRDKDVFMSPKEKSDFANSQSANAFVSIHVNNTDENEKQTKSGIEVYLSKNNSQEFSNVLLGSAILQSFKANFNIVPALIQRQVGVWVLKNSDIPAALIECGYITNAVDAKNLKDDAKIELMAKNILQGVAMYANNKVEKSGLYQIQNKDADTSVPEKPDAMESQTAPLYVVDGKIISKPAIDKIAPASIESINVLKDKSATDKYGDKGKNGVVEITLKDAKEPKAPINPPTPPVPPLAAPNAAPTYPLKDTLKLLRDTLVINSTSKAD